MSTGENLLGALGSLTLAVALSAAIMLVQRRKAREGWSATVTRIAAHPGHSGEGGGEDLVRIHYVRDDGKHSSLDLPCSRYPLYFHGLQTGDRLVKPPGETIPRRVPAHRAESC